VDYWGRSLFASPWHSGPQWGDIPLRFGDRPFARIDPGQSSLALRGGPLEVGAATENQWWGPGKRTALLLSNNAPGFPHVFVRTARALRTPVGNFEGRWLLGALSESPYFDSDTSNDLRSLSGFAFTYRSGLAPNLTMGAARVVYSSVEGVGGLPARAADVFARWEERVLHPQDPTDVPPLGWPQPKGTTSEQMISAFGRAILPDDGLEFYVEWARSELPTSFRDLLAQPNHSQAFTLGAQWVKPVWSTSMVRFEAEASYLEESATFDTRPVGSYYVSRSIPQGYTHRGQVLGAATGPGSSSQWLGADFLAPRWRIGLLGGRIRWENDEYYRFLTRTYVGHDVSIFGGVRAGVEILGMEWSAEAVRGDRMNYLFQNPAFTAGGEHAIDVRNTTIRIEAQPMVRRRTPVR
jgi:hypothetical protein